MIILESRTKQEHSRWNAGWQSQRWPCRAFPRNLDHMAFLRTLFWIVVTVIVVVFSVRNWVPVPVNLFGDTVVETKLPMLLFIGFLIGFVPLYAWHRAVKWRHNRKLSAIERTPPPVVTPPPAAPTPTSSSDPFQAE
jgi:uncharacterized integral membrane protein